MFFPPTRHPGEGRDLVETHSDFSSRDPGLCQGDGTRRPRRRREDGFTLVELMVVIVIIGLLATVVIINVVPALDTASETRAKADIETIDQAVQRFYMANRRYPTTEEGLASLRPYLRRISQDPWNRAYLYAAPGPNGQPYAISSLGADGRAGGSGKDADITSN